MPAGLPVARQPSRRCAWASPWVLAWPASAAASLRAQGDDRVGESALVTGPVTIEYNAGKKVQVAQEGLYYLDYGGGRLLAAVPCFQQTVGGPASWAISPSGT